MLKDPLYIEPTNATMTNMGGKQEVTATVALLETAANKNVTVDHCPICDKPMKKLLAAGLPSFTCFDHRITMPAQDGGNPTTHTDPN